MVIFNLYNKLLQSPRRNDFTLTMIKQSLTTSLNKSSNSSQTPLSIVAKPNRFMSRSSSSRRTTEVTLSLLCLLDCMAAGAEHKDLPGKTQPPASALLPLSTFLQQSNKGFFFSPLGIETLFPEREAGGRGIWLRGVCLLFPFPPSPFHAGPDQGSMEIRTEVSPRASLSSNSSHERCRPVSPVRLSVTLWIVAHQAPLSLEFSRQESWHQLPFPSPGDLPNPGIGPGSPASQTDS